MQKATISDWFDSPSGRYVLAWETAQFDSAVDDVFGFNAVQVGLPHILEFSPHAHRILREAERVLMPEGSIVISGFNPLSLWGAKRAMMHRSSDYPWCGRVIGLLRVEGRVGPAGFGV